MSSSRRLALGALLLLPAAARAQIRVNPTGVNVNAQGASTAFLTFGGLARQVPAEAFWCGELIAAAPDIGKKCDPATIFGSLPLRFNLSSLSGVSGFTDIMTIPPSVARRAYQAAEDGEKPSFFYVRRFVSSVGGPDEYVAVTCRLTGGGARSPFALTEVRVAFAPDRPLVFIQPGDLPPRLSAEISYNGTGRLVGRWEVVLPGEEPPLEQDLLTEGSLPVEERGLQHRYTQVSRFNVFLAPGARFSLPGPDPRLLPRTLEGQYLVLLRIEASDDKESDSNLGLAGAGSGVVHSGAVAGFPLPVLRYYVGGGNPAETRDAAAVSPLLPADGVEIAGDKAVVFSWIEGQPAAWYRVEVESRDGTLVLGALLAPGIAVYRAPSWLKERVPNGEASWRVIALDQAGTPLAETAWRRIRLAP